MRVLYFGIYNPNYSRNRVLIKGLRENGVEVLECNVPYRSWVSYFKLFWRYIFLKKVFDVIIVGFPGQEMMPLIRLLTLRLGSGRARKPIIFDAFTSHYGGYILDRNLYKKSSWRAKYYRFIDRFSCKLANKVLLDTNAHIDFFVKEFGLSRGKFRRIFVGTDSDIFYPKRTERNDGKFLIHFHGHYIPLQGVKYIIQAAKLLERENVLFNIIGRGQDYQESRNLAAQLNLSNINFAGNVLYNKLPEYISSADVCLGIFGKTLKTDIVIPNKVYDAIACAKPVITADTPAISELFKDKEDILLCRKADPEDLAEKILLLKNNSDLRERIGQGGYQLFKNYLTEIYLGAQLKRIIHENFT